MDSVLTVQFVCEDGKYAQVISCYGMTWQRETM